jgi:hypothetical protein
VGSEKFTATPDTTDAAALTFAGHAIVNAGGGGGGGGVGVVGVLHALRHAIDNTRIALCCNVIGRKDQSYRVVNS